MKKIIASVLILFIFTSGNVNNISSSKCINENPNAIDFQIESISALAASELEYH